MAVPISLNTKPADSTEEMRMRLAEATADNAEAILAALAVLQEAQKSGALDVMRGVLGARGEIVEKLAEVANTPESIRAVRNLASLAKILGTIDPEVLHRFADELARNNQQHAIAARAPGLWRIFRTFFSQDSRRALAGTAAFLEAFGRALVSKQTPK